MRTTVGIATAGRPADVDRLLGHLLGGTPAPDEVLVVDDSDDHETTAVADDRRADTDLGDRLRYVHRPNGDSLPGARNVVVERSRGEILCFLDDDTVPMEGWLPALVAAYERYPDVGAVGGPALQAAGDCTVTVPVDRRARNRNVITKYGEVSLATDRWVPPEPVRTDALVGANMSFRRAALSEVGGFDTGYGGTAVYEETDVMARLSAAGHDLLYHPEAAVYHFERANGGVRAPGRSDREEYYWLARNAVRFRWRNFRERFPAALLRAACWSYGLDPDWRSGLATAVDRTLGRYERAGVRTRPGHTAPRDHTDGGWRNYWRLVGRSYGPAPLWKELLEGVGRRDPAKLGWLSGYLDGIRYETDIGLRPARRHP
jgi:GT2 family glycosyltransferase